MSTENEFVDGVGWLTYGSDVKAVLGSKLEATAGATTDIKVGISNEMFFGVKNEFNLGLSVVWSKTGQVEYTWADSLSISTGTAVEFTEKSSVISEKYNAISAGYSSTVNEINFKTTKTYFKVFFGVYAGMLVGTVATLYSLRAVGKYDKEDLTSHVFNWGVMSAGSIVASLMAGHPLFRSKYLSFEENNQPHSVLALDNSRGSFWGSKQTFGLAKKTSGIRQFDGKIQLDSSDSDIDFLREDKDIIGLDGRGKSRLDIHPIKIFGKSKAIQFDGGDKDLSQVIIDDSGVHLSKIDSFVPSGPVQPGQSIAPITTLASSIEVLKDGVQIKYANGIKSTINLKEAYIQLISGATTIELKGNAVSVACNGNSLEIDQSGISMGVGVNKKSFSIDASSCSIGSDLKVLQINGVNPVNTLQIANAAKSAAEEAQRLAHAVQVTTKDTIDSAKVVVFDKIADVKRTVNNRINKLIRAV